MLLNIFDKQDEMFRKLVEKVNVALEWHWSSKSSVIIFIPVVRPAMYSCIFAAGGYVSSLWPEVTRFYELQGTHIRGLRPPWLLVGRAHKVFWVTFPAEDREDGHTNKGSRFDDNRINKRSVLML